MSDDNTSNDSDWFSFSWGSDDSYSYTDNYFYSSRPRRTYSWLANGVAWLSLITIIAIVALFRWVL